MKKFEIGDLVVACDNEPGDVTLAIVEYVDDDGTTVLLPLSGELTWFYHEEVELA